MHPKILRARSALVQSHFFWATIVLKRETGEDDRCPTAYTDGERIVFNPAALDRWTIDETIGVLAHESGHIARKHHLRRGGRDPKLWNESCDASINCDLIDTGFRLPDGAIVEREYQGLSAEEIYARKMAAQPPPQDQGGGQPQTGADGDQNDDGRQGDSLPDCGSMGWVCDVPGQGGAQPGPAELAQANEDVDVLLAQAAALAKARGELPAHMARQIEQELYPQRNGWDLLRQYMLDHARNDYAWVPPNARMLYHGYILPGARSNEMDTMVVAIDTSGSIGQAELDVFATCVQGVVDAIQPRRVITVYCDSKVQRVDEFSMGQPVEFEAIGGGGTKFQPVFDQLEADGIVPACVVYLTDGDCWDRPENPGYPVVWACTTDRQQAFGEHIRIQRGAT
jgi:predicted metal-dependent peptidase